MAFKELNDLNPDTTISLGGTNRKTNKTNPTEVEGYYMGSRKIADNKKKSGFSFIHVFQTAKGMLGVWGKTDMDRKVTNVPLGTMTRVTATGTRPTPNGDMYVFKVAIDDSNTVEVVGSVNQEQTEDANEGGTAETESYSTAPAFDEEEELETQSTAATLAAEQAAKKARVHALLNKNKKA